MQMQSPPPALLLKHLDRCALFIHEKYKLSTGMNIVKLCDLKKKDQGDENRKKTATMLQTAPQNSKNGNNYDEC